MDLRASNVPFDFISEIILNTFGIRISKSTAINAVYRVAETLEAYTQDTISKIQKSDHIHIDEITYRYNGILVLLIRLQHTRYPFFSRCGIFFFRRYVQWDMHVV